jgi:hypothetical protein
VSFLGGKLSLGSRDKHTVHVMRGSLGAVRFAGPAAARSISASCRE